MITCYWDQIFLKRSTWKVAHQSPPVDGCVDGMTRLCHHSRPHAGSLGMTRSSDLREMIYALTAEHEWLVRRVPGIGSHIGREGNLKGPGQHRT